LRSWWPQVQILLRAPKTTIAEWSFLFIWHLTFFAKSVGWRLEAKMGKNQRRWQALHDIADLAGIAVSLGFLAGAAALKIASELYRIEKAGRTRRRPSFRGKP
jgi:hypothetical protein